MSKSLLQQVALGDEQAVHDCLRTYSGLVWSLARRMCRDTAETEDAVQDIFVSLWRSAVRFDPTVASETTFVAMIARRRLIDRARKRSRDEPTVSVEFAEPVQVPKTHTGQVSEEARRAMEVFAELGEDQQKVLRLAILQGLAHEKIATATGIPLGTVKTHIRRGLMQVRGRLSEMEGGGSSRRDVERVS